MLKEYKIVFDENEFPTLIDVRSFNYNKEDFDENEILYFMNDKYKLSAMESEVAYLISMDLYNRPKAIYQISMGDYKSCSLYNRTIAMFLLLTASRNFIVIHNHPDGMCYSSKDDIAVKYSLDALSSLLDLNFNGSYIITKNGWCMVTEDIIHYF